MTPDRLVIFDVDGTLVDSQEHIVAAMSAAFDTISLTLPTRQEVLSIVGLSLGEAIARLLPDAAPSVRDVAVQAYKQAFGHLRAGTLSPLYPGAAAALDGLHARDGFQLGIATGKSRRGLAHILEAHGLERHFATCQVADDHPSKPHPSMLLAALAETGVEPARAVMLGDTTYDIEMARAAGVAAIGVSWGYHRPEALAGAGATQVIDRFDDLEAALVRIWGAA
ncbi:HAD-IA family hydrolase [Albidovulum sp.]|uniref:HAD-IA family hydrolase n=1 Tax=Albidovulum sp. TaxID=1872424 RepID=UPI001D844034|nr:HAD-IA family hydrolase [Paracoccaceae bacterium]HPE26355.1 HAD-IA family hydrolase [Albidovulum sp.]MCB2119564.1 HAD-IA family hydrolase [Paracoccaceae bacterium]MCB2122637.1 HAD-IA family hydrolase [Paracoccaceae bacterium]MCB2140137.1 HAD-IA family hydrolase [Paracoccaceae bacterium]